MAKWEAISTGASTGRRGHCAVVLGDFMIIHGGQSPESPLADFRLYSFG